jgi:hypothetical protein
MKKLSFFLIVCFLILPLYVYAANNNSGDSLNDNGRSAFRISDRIFEVGLNFNLSLSNNYLAITDIFQETLYLDIDKLADGFNMNLGIGVTPFYFSFNSRKGWGFGLSTNIEGTGVLGLSGNMLTLSEANNDKSNLSGAIFAELGIDTHFYIQKFKITFRPAVYYTLAYVEPDISYTFSHRDGTVLNIGYDMRVYTPFSMENFSLEKFNFQNDFTGTPGFDFSFGVEYPLSSVIGLDKKIRLLDFDVGVNFINIPIMPSQLNNYMRLFGGIGGRDPVKISDGDGFDGVFDSFVESNDPEYGEANRKIERPFRMNAWVNWRPFGNKLLTVTPSAGFSINALYIDPFSFEFGLKTRLDLANIFIVTAGVCYEDRLWINSVALALNFRVFELDIGADIRSQDFLTSWSGNGIGLNLGLKFGW